MCVCIRFPHKTFIYSNDLEEVARVPGRLALETGDRLSFLPSFLPSFLSDLLCLGPWVFISRRGSHGGGFRPLTPFPVHEATKPHRTIEPGLRAGIRFIAFRSSPSPIDIRFSLFLSFFFPPSSFFLWAKEKTGPVKLRAKLKSKAGGTGDHVGEENSFQRYCVRGEKSIASSRTLPSLLLNMHERDLRIR